MNRDLRRFPRVQVKPALAELISGLGAQMRWPNEELAEVLDLSYRGVAARRPGLYPVAVTKEVEVELQLGIFEPFPVTGRVAWCNLDWVGLELVRLNADAHQAMAKYLDYKLRGATLRPVERVFFSPGQSFQRWYQAPGGIHVFIWESTPGQIEHVSIEVDGQTLGFDRGRHVGQEPSRGTQKALLILSQMPDPEMEDFLRSLGRARTIRA